MTAVYTVPHHHGYSLNCQSARGARGFQKPGFSGNSTNGPVLVKPVGQVDQPIL